MSVIPALSARFFTLRIWVVGQGNDGIQWRARLYDIHTKEVTCHKDWQALIESIENTLEYQMSDPSSSLQSVSGVEDGPD